jgi:hypothetical protein
VKLPAQCQASGDQVEQLRQTRTREIASEYPECITDQGVATAVMQGLLQQHQQTQFAQYAAAEDAKFENGRAFLLGRMKSRSYSSRASLLFYLYPQVKTPKIPL